MDLGLYAAANGMKSLEDRQAVIANNIANASTPGFRSHDGVVRGFYEVFLDELGSVHRYNARTAPGGGLKLDETFSDTSNGPIVRTGNALDVALQGPGFFAVQTPFGERYTRNGNFSVNADGILVTSEGHPVLGAGGNELNVEGGEVRFGQDGSVRVAGQLRGQLQILDFEDPHGLTREGTSLYRASEEVLENAIPSEATQVMERSLEHSNVQVTAELVNMMLGSRAYAANQKVIGAVDDTLSLIIQRVGTPQ